MNPVYLYIQFKIKDADAFQQYAERVPETVKRYGGETIAVNKAPTAMQGDINADVCVIQKWPSQAAAHAWHDSSEYAPLKALRDDKAMDALQMIFVPGV